MRVAYVAPYFDQELASARGETKFRSPASCQKISGIASAMTMAGFDVTIVSPILFSRRNIDFHLRREGRVGAVKVLYPSCLDLPFINLIWMVFVVAVELFKLKPQKIVFYNFYIPTSMPAYITKLLSSVPLIVDYEDGHFADPERSWTEKMVHGLLERLGNYLVSGAFLAAPALRERLTTGNICVCRGITDRFTVRDESSGIPIVVYSGRLDKVRGIDIFLEAVPKIKQPARYIISGYGPLRHIVEARVEELKQRAVDIDFVGFLDDAELKDLMSSATVLVNPQRSNNLFAHYSFPSKMCAYMSTGAVVVSSAVSDIAAFAEGRLLIYEKDSPHSLAQLIDDVLVNPGMFENHALNAKKWVEENCSPAAVARLLDTVVTQA